MILTSALVSSRGARHAAFGPATERMLRGQSAGFEEHLILPHEVTCVGCDPVERAAARRWAEAAVRSAAGVDRGTELASPRRPPAQEGTRSEGLESDTQLLSSPPQGSPHRVGVRRSGKGRTGYGFQPTDGEAKCLFPGGSFDPWMPPSVNIAVAGCGPLRGPPSQPAFMQAGQGSSISVVSVAEPGNLRIEAGSATAASLDEIE